MATPDSFDVPYRDQVLTKQGVLSTPWVNFFRGLFDRVLAFGGERVVQLNNNQSTALEIAGMKVNSRAVSTAIVEYYVQRVTTTTDLVEGGAFVLTYNPSSEDWALSVIYENKPDDAGVVFSVDTAGQVDYTTSNISGTSSLSRIVYRMRTLAGKSTSYSSQGVR